VGVVPIVIGHSRVENYIDMILAHPGSTSELALPERHQPPRAVWRRPAP
jgi:hypothetical protein